MARGLLLASGSAMSDFSGVFDQLADALKKADASPSTTLRQHRPPRRHARSHPQPPPAPDPLVPVTIIPEAILQTIPARPPKQAKPPREIDRSRDHAVYAAPHRPSRPHFHSRPDDVITERIFRRAMQTASNASRSLPIVTMAFGITMALGLLAVLAFFR